MIYNNYSFELPAHQMSRKEKRKYDFCTYSLVVFFKKKKDSKLI